MTDGGKLNWQLKKPEGFQGLCHRSHSRGEDEELEGSPTHQQNTYAEEGKTGSGEAASHTGKHFQSTYAVEGGMERK